MENKITFVVPLGKGTAWENNELRYMLRSLDKHCKFDFDVVLYTTAKVEWFKGRQVIVPRVYPKQVLDHFAGKEHYENYYDVINKLRSILSDDLIKEDFVFIYDDVLLLTPLKESDIKQTYALDHYNNMKSTYDSLNKNKWVSTTSKSLEICKDHSYALYVYETHLPRYYKKSQVKKMLDKHVPEIGFIPYSTATVYYNMYYSTPDIDLSKNNIKAAFYGMEDGKGSVRSKDIHTIKKNLEGKTWANYTNPGLTGTFKLWIEETFKDKSRFE